MRRAKRSTTKPLRWTTELARFVALFLGVMALLVGLWSFLAPAYSTVVMWSARPLFRLFEAPNVTVLDARGAEIWIYRIVGPGEIAPFTWFDRYTFFAVIPLLALLVATPGVGWRRRLVKTSLGIGVLVAIHTAYLIASVELAYVAIGLTPVGAFLARTLDVWQVGVRVLWEAAPVAIWIALTLPAWKRLLRRVKTERRDEAPSGDALRVSG